jgi:hypothetical protein
MAFADIDAVQSPTKYYFPGYATPMSNTACFDNDVAASQAMVQAIKESQNFCSASFSDWTTGWPNTSGYTDGYTEICLDPGLPFSLNAQHREVRGYSYSYVTGSDCSLQRSNTSSIQRRLA